MYLGSIAHLIIYIFCKWYFGAFINQNQLYMFLAFAIQLLVAQDQRKTSHLAGIINNLYLFWIVPQKS